ncbi:DNA (cytosine-5-)-methyltransferase [Haladaptatus sp. AB618]|uniref:DNA cytosine methyltransferase n=1 Tax=Haladaptatus sp. AB618 TaxID=2934173 RepID=UPI00209BC1B4|nr:DNA (cytosine-5-)-methyltransferase [Haladaptatus sp. AB618]MCO8256743.1 DNA (cytosine-5-)-methyltransferase [Haladaptatus sp. AB618]
MPESVMSRGSSLAIVDTAPTAERESHKQFLLENVEFLIDTLTAEHMQRQRFPPTGCPSAIPEKLARKRSSNADICRYLSLHRRVGETNDQRCMCQDPLAGSDDPLDAVAAVVLGGEVTAPSERFFERVPRKIVAKLREDRTWREIAAMDTNELHEALQSATPRKGVGSERVARLDSLLDRIQETDYTDDITLCGFSNVQYSTYVEFLKTIPGIGEGDAWWLLQTAFDKPIWPVDSYVDDLLYSLGLLTSEELSATESRRIDLEDQLIDRQIPALYRSLATHVISSGPDSCGKECEIRKFLLSHRLRKQQSEQEGPTVVDLFAGAGGLSCGLSRSGYDIRWAIDIEPDAVATYRLNHPEIPHENVICDDIREVNLSASIREAVQDPDVIVGGPPCQSLSQAGYRSRRANDESYSILGDERTTLYTKYVEAVDELRPKAIVMENVEGMVNEVGDTGIRVIDWVIEDLEALGGSGKGYQVDFCLQDLARLGIPQNRERVLLVGIRDDLVEGEDEVNDLLNSLSTTDSACSIRQGLSGLPRLRRGEGGRVLAKRESGGKSDYVKNNNILDGTNLCFNHQAREHPMEKDQILFDEGLEPGDTGWDVKYNSDGEYAKYIEYDVGTAENPRFGDKYRKLRWSEPSPTIVAHLAKDANGYVLPDYYEHARPDPERADPERNRGITPREAARLQSFPDKYIFLGSFTSWFRQIGNAVPPIAGKIVGDALKSILTEDTSHNIQTTEGHLSPQTASND